MRFSPTQLLRTPAGRVESAEQAKTTERPVIRRTTRRRSTARWTKPAPNSLAPPASRTHSVGSACA